MAWITSRGHTRCHLWTLFDRVPSVPLPEPNSIQFLFPPGEGNGNPLQYSCLENPMDGAACWAIVHGVTKCRTRLSGFSFFSFISSRVKTLHCLLYAVAVIIYISNLTSSNWKKCFLERIFQNVKGQSVHLHPPLLLKDRTDSRSFCPYPCPLQDEELPSPSCLLWKQFPLLRTFSDSVRTQSRVMGFSISDPAEFCLEARAGWCAWADLFKNSNSVKMITSGVSWWWGPTFFLGHHGELRADQFRNWMIAPEIQGHLYAWSLSACAPPFEISGPWSSKTCVPAIDYSLLQGNC